jgi:hypothetical protein
LKYELISESNARSAEMLCRESHPEVHDRKCGFAPYPSQSTP